MMMMMKIASMVHLIIRNSNFKKAMRKRRLERFILNIKTRSKKISTNYWFIKVINNACFKVLVSRNAVIKLLRKNHYKSPTKVLI